MGSSWIPWSSPVAWKMLVSISEHMAARTSPALPISSALPLSALVISSALTLHTYARLLRFLVSTCVTSLSPCGCHLHLLPAILGHCRTRLSSTHVGIDLSPLYETIYERPHDARPSHTTFSFTPTATAPSLSNACSSTPSRTYLEPRYLSVQDVAEKERPFRHACI